ncbi:MAG TPA: flagellar basal body P-ring protein FlgI [Phycisphaerales bacterium]|nr:flagellar basal body P-ring protein FlgI [Phycisphaerales bacterium]
MARSRINVRLSASVAQLAALLAAPTSGMGQPADPAGAPGAPTPAAAAPAADRPGASISIQDIARLGGQGRSPLRGIGLVVGLNGTGDPGTELALARPLAQVYAANNVPLPDLKELARSKSVALVWVSCEAPETGARVDDRLDVTVSVMHSATNLEGGELLLTPLTGPFAGDARLFAMASGPVSVPSLSNPRVGRVRLGAQVTRDIRSAPIGDVLELVIEPHARGWPTTRAIATEINGLLGQDEAGADPPARAVDEATVRVAVPPAERADPAAFISRIVSARLSPALLDLPAQVIVNERTGSIVVTGDVEISPVAIEHKDLVVTTVVPPPTPTPQDPLVLEQNWVGLATGGRGSERARLADLLEAFKQLNVPVKDQIAVLAQIHRSGRLHARFIVE